MMGWRSMLTESSFKNAKTSLAIGVYFSNRDKELCEENLKELKRLCDTYGLDTKELVACPIKKIDAGMFLGKGKLEELHELVEKLSVDVCVFDDEISPSQQRNLEKLFKRPVIDRTELIIEVFAQRAQTREACLQIELAKAQYQLPRLKRMWTHLSRQSGGGGGSGGGGYLRGEGELQIELDRRMVRSRITQLKEDLKVVVKQRGTQRHQRVQMNIPCFAIVGYTNAGKSTLLNALTDANVLVEDKLFATLDTTTRKYVLPNKQGVLLIDTVGFIRKIPHTLVMAFKSTLEEVLYTDFLIHLIDVSSSMAEEQALETVRVLEELGAQDIPIITVFNKIDLCATVDCLKGRYPDAIAISALTKEGFSRLTETMMEKISFLRKRFHLKIPQSEYRLVSQLMRDARVLESTYEGNDIVIHVEVPKKLEDLVQPFIVVETT
jgi:GTPase